MEPSAAAEILVNMGLVAGSVEAIKRAFGPRFSTERFGPILALVVGVGLAEAGAYAGWYTTTPGMAVLQGLIAGLSASGLYRTVTKQT